MSFEINWFNDLPLEIWHKIINSTSFDEMKNIRLICKKFNDIVKEIWDNTFEKKGGLHEWDPARYEELNKISNFNKVNLRQIKMDFFPTTSITIPKDIGSLIIKTKEKFTEVLSQTVLLQRAKDTVKVWDKLVRGLPFNQYGSNLELGKFNEWVTKNQNLLSLAVKGLDLEKLHLRIIPKEIEKLKSLKYLNLGLNDFKKLPSEITSLSNLETLNLDRIQLDSIPIEFEKLQNLKELSLHGAWIKEIPPVITKLPNLVSLALGENDLNKIPEEIQNLSKLEHLDISHNYGLENKENLPLEKLQNLKSLFLETIGITKFPNNILKLLKLEHLSLSGNELTEFPSDLKELETLQKLELSNCGLTALPLGITTLPKLKTLDLHDNPMTQFPEEIQKLNNLETLDLAENQLTHLPEGIGELKSLKNLRLEQNQLTILPSSFSKLENLEHLNIFDNEFPDAGAFANFLPLNNRLKVYVEENHKQNMLTYLKPRMIEHNLKKGLKRAFESME